MADIYDKLVENPTEIPKWFVNGKTILIPKQKDSINPAHFRPITCLPTMYKIFSSIIDERIKYHIKINSLIPEEQKGCGSDTYGCIDQALIDCMITDEAKGKQRNLSVAWIDYRKAFDSVPHDWIIDSLKIHKFDEKIINFFSYTMTQWKTNLYIRSDTQEITTETININCGIFQGDIPSPDLFILSLLPLSFLLRETKMGFVIGERNNMKISHLLYVDDLKLYASNDNQLRSLINITKHFSDDIRMSFGLDKCNKLSIIKGRLVSTNSNIPYNQGYITELNNGKTYKYLGFEEDSEIKKMKMKKDMKNEYFSRIKKILKSELNGKNTIEAINAYAVPALSYGFAVLDWSITELEELDRNTRNLLKTNKIMHKQSSVERLYLPRKEGGRGLLNITKLYKRCIINTFHYISNSPEELLKAVLTWSGGRKQKALQHKAERYCNEIGEDIHILLPLAKTILKPRVKNAFLKKNKTQFEGNALHGQYAREINEPHIDRKQSLAWLSKSWLKAPTESTICAIQEQAITTKYIEKHIHKTSNSDTCRLCHTFPETIHHVVAGCPSLSQNVYTQRHDNVAKYVYIKLGNYAGLQMNEKWFEIQPDRVIENEKYKILWNLQIMTDHEVNHNKPDIVFLDKTEKTVLIIDIAIPMDRNVVTKRFEKLRNYTNLAIELKNSWNLTNVFIIPVIIGCTGTIHRELKKDISKLPEFTIKDLDKMQEIALLGTAYTWRHFSEICKYS